MVLEAWADATDVLNYTGETATDPEIQMAQFIVEIFVGTTFLATPNLAQTNLRLLTQAVSYQTVWMQTRPDLFTHMDVDNFSQDGASHTPGHVNAQLLAPLAHRCIRRLTWLNKPLRIRRRYSQWDYNNRMPLDSAVADDNRPWTPMR